MMDSKLILLRKKEAEKREKEKEKEIEKANRSIV